MPRAIAKGDTSHYLNVRAGAVRAICETNDCTVVAFAAACGITYDVAHETLERLGRKPRKGVHMYKVLGAARALGFKVEEVSMQEMIAKYPRPHNQLRCVTSHHPDRFHRAWADGHNYWLRNRGHVLAIVNGVTVDWSRGRALRGRTLWRVT